MIRLLLVDDQTIFREGLRKVIEDWPDVEVAAFASSLDEALGMDETVEPDIVLTEMLPSESLSDPAIERMSTRFPQARVTVLTTSESDADLFEAIEAGASGYLLKNMPIEMLHDSIRAVMRGEYPIAPSMMAKCIALLREVLSAERGKDSASECVEPLLPPDAVQRPLSSLTPREEEILTLLTGGLSNQEIARALFISEKTVKKHLNNIFVKINVTNRSQAAVYAIRTGLA